MADRARRIVLNDVSGGRNGVDPPTSLAPNTCVDAVNVEFWHAPMGRKRRGLSSAVTTFSSGGPFTGKISSLFRHVPGTNETAAEQWAVDDALVIGRRAGSASFIAPTLKDSITGNGWDVDFATLGGKLFIAYPASSGFSTPGAPTVANTGAGSYTATLRYYRVRWIQQTGGVTVRRSPVGTSQSFTPSGAGTAARVTRPTAAGQGETHWELEVSYDNSNFRVLYGDGGIYAPIAIATTTGDDSSVLTSTTIIDTFTSSGTWTRPSWVTSVSYLIVGGGGGGGGDDVASRAGGGGGGEVKTGTSSGLGSASYSITVGTGGAGGTTSSVAGTSGGSSTFNSITASGGSGGGGSTASGASGVNGGGAGEFGSAGSGSNHSGGAGASNAGGGGAGNGADGGAASSNTGGNGGNGTASSISGSSVTYGGGGGGGGLTSGGTGGTGGGGAGGTGAGVNGTDGLGGGGGGAGFANNGGDGGDGIVILSYSSLSITSAGSSNADNSDRLHVWDGSTVRRAGFATPAAPTAANTGAGAYAATLRYYRVRWTQQSGGVTIRRSEPGSSVAFTPSGAGTAARVTQPTVANEGETHWEVEGSSDNVTFYTLSAVAIATTTYDDSTAPASYSTGSNLSALTGTYTAQKSYRFIAADQGRLIGFGNWTATAKQNDIEVGAVFGSLNVGDAERVDTTSTYRYTLDENDSGAPTGLKGPLFGNFYAFKARQLWELSPTGQTSNPYRRTPISKIIGCVQRPASCMGEDAAGNPALYFFSHRGLYRYGTGGLEYIGKGIEDYVLGPTASLNLSASKVIAWTLYYPKKRQVWVGWATGSSNDPCQMAIYDVGSGGWSRVPTGDKLANIRTASLFANSIDATMTGELKPYLASATANTTLYRGDDDSATDDAGTAFRAYVEHRPLDVGGPGVHGWVGEAIVLAPVASGVTLTATVIPDWDDTYAKSGTALLTASGSETRVSRKLEGSNLGDAEFVTYRIGDASAISNAWSIDRMVVPMNTSEAL